MYNNISRYVKKVNEDSLSTYLDHLSFQVNGYGRFSQQEISSFSPFFSDDIELILIVRGHSVLHTPDRKYQLVPGSLAVLRPFHIYTAICQPGEKLYYYYIHFSISPFHLTDSYLNRIAGEGDALTVSPGQLPDFIPAFRSMLEDWRNDVPGLMTLIRSYLYILSVHLARLTASRLPLTESDRTESSYDLEMTSQALDYIAGHLNGPILQEDLSRQLGVSVSALYKLFRRVLHASPSEYIAKTRLRQAEIMLRSTGCTIAEAAKACGFCSASHLSRQFKTAYGLPPSAYLKENPTEKESRPD